MKFLLGALWLLPTVVQAQDYFQTELAERRQLFDQTDSSAAAVEALLGVLDLWTWLPDQQPLVHFLDRASESRQAQSEVRAHALYFRAQADAKLGNFADAEKRYDALGLIGQMWAIGPFDNESELGHETVYLPERDLRSGIDTARVSGKGRDVRWYRLPARARDGAVALGAVAEPYCTFYVAAAIKVGRRTDAALRIGSSGSLRGWLNGQSVLDDNHYRNAYFDQIAVPIVLAAGWNRLVLKISLDQRAAKLLVRLSRPDGSSIEGLKVSGTLADLQHRSPAQRARHSVSSLLAALQGFARAHYEHVVLAERESQRTTELLREAALHDRTASHLILAAQAERDHNDKRRLLETALEASPSAATRAAIWDEIGQLYQIGNRDRPAETAWQAALQAAPTYAPAVVHLASAWATQGVPARAAALLGTLGTSPPLGVKFGRGEVDLERGLDAEAVTHFSAVVAGDATATAALQQLATLAEKRGRVQEALVLVARLEQIEDAPVRWALRRADLLESSGQSDAAEEAVGRALDVAPENGALVERHGRLLHRMGRETEALDELHHALALRPSDSELRTYVGALDSQRSATVTDEFSQYAADISTLLTKRALQESTGAPARVLTDRTVVRSHANGLNQTFAQRVVQILDERGARSESDFEVHFAPSQQVVDLRRTCVHRASGQVTDAVETEEHDLSEPWYGLYYDLRATVIHFPALQPGDVIEVEYVISDLGSRNELGDHFSDLHLLADELPRLETLYVAIAPVTRPLYFNQPRIGLERRERVVGADRRYEFRAGPTPAVVNEPEMPGATEVAPYLHVSSFKNWAEVAAWYRPLLRDQLEPTLAIRHAVHTALQGATDERDKIRRIYELVITQTRYVGLEFGIHGYQPYRVGQIFSRKFGDCKDKASLLHVMLKLADIESTLVLARTRHGGDLDELPASPTAFDHAIVYLPKFDLYLDGTAEFSGADELPAQDQDIWVLHINSGKLHRTPEFSASHNRTQSRWRVAFGSGNTPQNALVSEEVTVIGESAHEWRQHYQSEAERQDKYAKMWNSRRPGASVKRVSLQLSRERPVEVLAEVEVPHYADVEMGRRQTMSVPLIGRETSLLRTYAALSERHHDVVLSAAWQDEIDITTTLPAGFTVGELPPKQVVTSPFGELDLRTRAQGSEVHVALTLTFHRRRIVAKDYAAFRTFLGKVDAVLRQRWTAVAPALSAR